MVIDHSFPGHAKVCLLGFVLGQDSAHGQPDQRNPENDRLNADVREQNDEEKVSTSKEEI
jgi:hypothetical protein